MRAKDIILGLGSLMNVFEALLARALTIDYLIFYRPSQPIYSITEAASTFDVWWP